MKNPFPVSPLAVVVMVTSLAAGFAAVDYAARAENSRALDRSAMAARLPLQIYTVHTNSAGAREMMRLGRGGCLRGPLSVFGEDGTVFSLEPGVEYPAGCGRRR